MISIVVNSVTTGDDVGAMTGEAMTGDDDRAMTGDDRAITGDD